MGNILHISFMLSICIAPISTSKDKNEINSFKQKITLRKCILILGLDHHCYVNRELVHIIMPALNTSAIIAHCNELVRPMGHLQAHQWDSQAVKVHQCTQDLQQPRERARHTCKHCAAHIPRCAQHPIWVRSGFQLHGSKDEVIPLEGISVICPESASRSWNAITAVCQLSPT